eukprot:m.255236 g.255236  ORF g.255236 m.255236 type:complete len:107 (+) comp26735_c0_seq19:488-808(+)
MLAANSPFACACSPSRSRSFFSPCYFQKHQISGKSTQLASKIPISTDHGLSCPWPLGQVKPNLIVTKSQPRCLVTLKRVSTFGKSGFQSLAYVFLRQYPRFGYEKD